MGFSVKRGGKAQEAVIGLNGDEDFECSILDIVQIELAAVNAILEALDDVVLPELQECRRRLNALVRALKSGAILPEYGEIELEKIQALRRSWSDNLPDVP